MLGCARDEEEDTCHMRRRIHVMDAWMRESGGGGYMSYEEEDTCHMSGCLDAREWRRRIHVI
jgi:hypothetical protein